MDARHKLNVLQNIKIYYLTKLPNN